MEVGVLEQRLRALSGVLDCSVSAEGVAVVVHPEVDPRLVELQAQVLLAEAGDRRPLLVVGGMTAGPRVLPPARPSGLLRPRRTGPSPLSLASFAVLVLVLLAVVPLASREGDPSSPGRQASGGGPSGLGRLPVSEEARPSGGASAAASTTEVVQLAVDSVGGPSGRVRAAFLAPPSTPSAGSSAAPPSAAPPEPTPAPTVTKRKGPARPNGGGRSSEVRAASRGVRMAAAQAPPGKGEPPGRRHGRRVH